MNYLSKRTLLVINKMSINLAGGMVASKGGNLRPGQSLGFVDGIYHNSVFGQELYPSVFHQAAAYMFYIIKNHSFLDGNKRTGLGGAVLFLERNAIVLSVMLSSA